MSGRRFYYQQQAERANRRRFQQYKIESENRQKKARETLSKWRSQMRSDVVAKHLDRHLAESNHPYHEIDRKRLAIHLVQRPTPDIQRALSSDYLSYVRYIQANPMQESLSIQALTLAKIATDDACKREVRQEAMETLLSFLAYIGNPVREILGMVEFKIDDIESMTAEASKLKNGSFFGRLFGRSRKRLRSFASDLIEQFDQS